MSIHDHNDDEIVHLPGIWEVLAKFAFAAAVPAVLLMCSFGAWLVVTIFSHDSRITVLEYASRQNRSGGSQTTSVNVGSADSTAAQAAAGEDHKPWLTVQEAVAKLKEDGVSITDKTFLNYIAEGRVEPAPEKSGKSWVVAEKFRIVQKRSDDFRIANTANAQPEN